mmetsp:Transcript_22875/g.70760  ORF Transcript_22875/g.70760 Transcript_22875/m.70760 type:complete len:222 (+) Transcript_22875:300-965(+)
MSKNARSASSSPGPAGTARSQSASTTAAVAAAAARRSPSESPQTYAARARLAAGLEARTASSVAPSCAGASGAGSAPTAPSSRSAASTPPEQRDRRAPARSPISSTRRHDGASPLLIHGPHRLLASRRQASSPGSKLARAVRTNLFKSCKSRRLVRPTASSASCCVGVIGVRALGRGRGDAHPRCRCDLCAILLRGAAATLRGRCCTRSSFECALEGWESL